MNRNNRKHSKPAAFMPSLARMRRWHPQRRRLTALVCVGMLGVVAAVTPELETALTQRYDANSRRLEQMSSNEVLSLKRKLKRFERLPAERQAQLRDFHQRLVAHPRRESLQRTLRLYFEWLASLDSKRQAELMDMQDHGQRLAKIREIRTEQTRALSFLPDSDFEHFDVWLRELAQDKQELIREVFRSTQRAGRRDLELDENSPPERLVRLLIRSPGLQSRIILDDDIRHLRDELSEMTSQMMADETIARNVIVHFVRNQFVGPEELQRFYVHELSPELRDELDKLPPDQMASQLRRMYQLKQIGIPRDQWGRRLPSSGRPWGN
ncbi:MAG TPA: hypothetical protein PKD54_06715 [Pirellulaceae bacterium]|nr:hypothetical protein [Pirellulaceae bacterium]